MSDPESSPDNDSIHELWLDSLNVEAEIVRSMFAYGRELTAELTKGMESYISERLLMGTSITDSEQELCSHIGFLCRRAGQETSPFIELNYLSGSQKT